MQTTSPRPSNIGNISSKEGDEEDDTSSSDDDEGSQYVENEDVPHDVEHDKHYSGDEASSTERDVHVLRHDRTTENRDGNHSNNAEIYTGK